MTAPARAQAAYEAHHVVAHGNCGMGPACVAWDELSPSRRAAWEAAAKAVLDLVTPEDVARAALAAQVPHAAPEMAAAMAETRKVRDVACKLLDLFDAPDATFMQRACVTRATLQRYAAEAGVRLDGRPL